MKCIPAPTSKKRNNNPTPLHLLLILLLFSQCSTGSPTNPEGRQAIAKTTQQDLKAILAEELEQHRDTLALPDTPTCHPIQNLTYLSPAYDTLLVKIAFKDSIKKDRMVQVNQVRSDLVRIEYCTPEYIVLNSACSGACWKYTFIFLKENTPPQSFYYAETVTNAPNLIAYRAGEHEYFEQKTIQDLRTGKKALMELYECQCFQDMDIAIDDIYLEGDSLFFVCDQAYNAKKIKALPLSALQ